MMASGHPIMPKSFKFKSLHIDILKDQKDAHLKTKHECTMEPPGIIFVHLVRLGILFRVEPMQSPF